MFELVVKINFELMYEVCMKFMAFYENVMFCLILGCILGWFVGKMLEK